MGRRALRQVDPDLDLSRHLKAIEDLPKPWDSGALFGCDAPLEVEVGTGKGLFIEWGSAARPDRNFLGIEIAPRYARFAAARLARGERANATVVRGDAQRVFNEFLPDASLSAVHVYFPDPWWKKRHHKRRIMNAVFLNDVARALVPGGSLHFWTDVREYFDESLNVIAAIPLLAGPFEVTEKPAEHDLDYRTHFERRMRKSALPVYRAEFRKDV